MSTTSSCRSTAPGQSAGDLGRPQRPPRRRRRRGSPLGSHRAPTYLQPHAHRHPVLIHGGRRRRRSRRRRQRQAPPSRTRERAQEASQWVIIPPPRPNPSSLNTQPAPTRKSIEPVSTHPHTLHSKTRPKKTRFPPPH